ncbi:t-SNARE [Blyttiomyces helicus]|uniref:t-SNARE n=1 Tax=Blyttiomyces helicus TaxID=388810 RepID=A0A4P9WTM2_9FUNG|nr:t-SNARE [Blyttiomyces helicus]|eukprot:RKO94426.1 t-SNARE [Blyttiomyces helicus]
MTVKDRTVEFHSAIDSILARSGPGPGRPAESHRLLHPSSHNSAPPVGSKTEFAQAASSIAREINTMVAKLDKLTRLAKSKSLFDDRPVEINELIYIIKQDIAKINQQIAQLAAYLRRVGAGGAAAGGGAPAAGGAAPSSGNRQVQEHSTNVITSLQSKLASTSNEFKNILEIRTQNMKEQKRKREQYSFTPAAGGGGSGGGSASGGGTPLLGGGGGGSGGLGLGGGALGLAGDGSVVIDFGGGGAGGTGGQMQLVQSSANVNMEIIESRSQAIESIESTIAELGQIYQNFATMIASQREMVQRIDENVLDVEVNVTGAHTQLLKYYQNISSNRWLMVKVFSVILVFFLMFVLMT